MSERARVWRPFPEQGADILCVEDGLGDVAPRIHRRFGITLVRSPAFVRVESSSGLVANQNRVLLIPQLQLYALRAQSALAQGPVTFLLKPRSSRVLMLLTGQRSSATRSVVRSWQRWLRGYTARGARSNLYP